jgi:hypothetical protein
MAEAERGQRAPPVADSGDGMAAERDPAGGASGGEGFATCLGILGKQGGGTEGRSLHAKDSDI